MGSMGLTIPFSHFNGQLAYTNQNSYTDLDFAKTSNQHLKDFCVYLEKANEIHPIIDIVKLKSDLDKGLFFESTIPESYGLGSSGALVAAVYAKYALQPIEPNAFTSQTELAKLKGFFANLESYFHGTSSGIDPLICYLNHPLCIENGQTISAVHLPLRKIESKDAIFLLNTGAPGKTAPLVEHFMDQLKQADYKKSFDQLYIPLVNQCISKLIEGDTESFYDSLAELSRWQSVHFSYMIPEEVRPVWENGIANGLYTLKLCGSGGGGFVLGFTRDYERTRLYFKSLQKDIIPVYQVASAIKV
jgi:mevalonate kinase